jgi:2-polyprenyl-3-methyl-5-hydroxy-6-metoxy-1,4-benzoquinol methylase
VPALHSVAWMLRILHHAAVCGDRDWRAEEFGIDFRRRDPWNFQEPQEQERFQQAIHLLDSVNGKGRFARALEIGCAEGMFTESLAPYCASLLAADISDVALDRARVRCARYPNIEFRRWELDHDIIPGQFDLIVLMAVLEYFTRPTALWRIREAISSALPPKGYLLLSTTKAAVSVETSWWGRYLIAGARSKHQFIARHPSLQVIDEFEGPFYWLMLVQKIS